MFQSTHPYRVWPAHKGRAAGLVQVSIHTPIQGVTETYFLNPPVGGFQSTHPYRVWHYKDVMDDWLEEFQSTHPYRVWLSWRQRHLAGRWCFNPHTHTGCDGSAPYAEEYWCGFNPHTHTGCDLWQWCCWCLGKVSIHTPIQGVTSKPHNVVNR